MLSDFEEAVAAFERHRRRAITSIETDFETATVACRLGCGHTATFTVACHPITGISGLSLELGDELDCDQCAERPQ